MRKKAFVVLGAVVVLLGLAVALVGLTPLHTVFAGASAPDPSARAARCAGSDTRTTVAAVQTSGAQTVRQPANVGSGLVATLTLDAQRNARGTICAVRVHLHLSNPTAKAVQLDTVAVWAVMLRGQKQLADLPASHATQFHVTIAAGGSYDYAAPWAAAQSCSASDQGWVGAVTLNNGSWRELTNGNAGSNAPGYC